MSEANAHLVDWTPVRALLAPAVVGARMRRRLEQLYEARDVPARAPR